MEEQQDGYTVESNSRQESGTWIVCLNGKGLSWLVYTSPAACQNAIEKARISGPASINKFTYNQQ